ncbi:erythromycin esterase family protein [Lentzea tibetensis]|uniref:Erythromycin esterase family protein n=1 Tax=Lentzea tibetensis TaxID=2591470 RepID=A0A563EKS0_9PSEU|nr:erythromycin esterase family protein [Lentzea tibetensis]TWP47472.1 erythromycin esterase family protein [Lentzea tibetensis]
MSQEICDFVTPSCDLLAFGEPTHQEPAFARVRNELFAQLVGRGFRSIALETDRVAALAVNDFVQDGIGSLDAVLSEGFSHGFGNLDGNRQLVTWMREHNQHRPPEERVSFHGFDAPTENYSAPSPRTYLEHARDYLGLDLELASLLGDDERWSRSEAILNAAESIGATADADRLRTLAQDMLDSLYARAAELIAATSRAEWYRIKTHLTAGIGLLRYHREAAKPLEQSARIALLLGTRDALMAQNLLDIRAIETSRGPTLVFAHNLHLRRNPSAWRMGDKDLTWSGAGAVMASLLGEQYTVVAGSLGRAEAFELGDPEPDTYEGFLQGLVTTWGLIKATAVTATRMRTQTTSPQHYFPLDQATVDCVDVILHISDGTTVARSFD